MVSQHRAELVLTGSIVEGFGEPLNVSQLPANLGSDYDVMFAFKKSDLVIEYLMKNEEFLHIFCFTSDCSLLNQLQIFDKGSEAFKLSSTKARELMKTVVNRNRPVNIMKSLLQNVFPFMFNTPQISRWVLFFYYLQKK